MSSNLEINYAATTDMDLLSLYHRKRDQQAFTELVRRYSSMVVGLAQRMTGCAHLAEDILQTTFLVLSKDAHRIRQPNALASWLYGVAFRISARQVKRRARQGVSMLKDEVMVSDDPLEKLSEQFEQQTAFEELNRLPEKMRAPMVLRYLQGKSNSEVAESLSLSESAVEGRLKRGRHQLRLRLARQGVTFAAAVAALEATKDYATAAERTELVAKTVEACFANGVGTDPLGIEVTQLANEEVLKMTTTSVLKSVMTIAVAVGVIATGWSIIGNVELNAQDSSDEVVLQSDETAALAKDTHAKIKGDKATGSYFTAKNTIKPGDAAAATWLTLPTGKYSVEETTAAEQRIMEALREPTTVEFQDETLANVMSVIQEDHNIRIVFDVNGLADENVETSETITCELSNIQLKSALNLMLDPYNLTTMIKDEVLMVTTIDRAEEHCVPRVYKPNPSWHLNPDALIKVITTTIAPTNWSEVGGPGSIVAINGGLVISASAEIHEQINGLLRQIDRIKK